MAKQNQQTSEAEGQKDSDRVQLTCNAGGHQFGETFTVKQARQAGVLEHCKPFPGSTDREIKQPDKTG